MAEWHPDPLGRHQERAHDGVRWTDQVRDYGIVNRDAADLRTLNATVVPAPAPSPAAAVAASPAGSVVGAVPTDFSAPFTAAVPRVMTFESIPGGTGVPMESAVGPTGAVSVDSPPQRTAILTFIGSCTALVAVALLAQHDMVNGLRYGDRWWAVSESWGLSWDSRWRHTAPLVLAVAFGVAGYVSFGRIARSPVAKVKTSLAAMVAPVALFVAKLAFFLWGPRDRRWWSFYGTDLVEQAAFLLLMVAVAAVLAAGVAWKGPHRWLYVRAGLAQAGALALGIAAPGVMIAHGVLRKVPALAIPVVNLGPPIVATAFLLAWLARGPRVRVAPAASLASLPAGVVAVRPTGYPAGGDGFVYPTNGFAIASLILGIFGGTMLSLTFGFVALSQIKATGRRQPGRGLALAGIILSVAWILALLVLVIVVAAASNEPSYGY